MQHYNANTSNPPQSFSLPAARSSKKCISLPLQTKLQNHAKSSNSSARAKNASFRAHASWTKRFYFASETFFSSCLPIRPQAPHSQRTGTLREIRPRHPASSSFAKPFTPSRMSLKSFRKGGPGGERGVSLAEADCPLRYFGGIRPAQIPVGGGGGGGRKVLICTYFGVIFFGTLALRQGFCCRVLLRFARYTALRLGFCY